MAKNQGISRKEALEILKVEDRAEILKIFVRATVAREEFFGSKIEMCSIINAKSGNCSEDCAFCAQSAKSKAKIPKYSLVSEEKMLKAAEDSAKGGSIRFSIVTSGRTLSESQIDKVCSAVAKIAKIKGMKVCASLGCLDERKFLKLKNAGLDRYHHNLEASESYFPTICSTKKYSEKIETVKSAKNLGLTVCSGGIFGMGESLEQRIELLETLKTLKVDCVPINFLNPIQGTKLERIKRLTPFECLKIISAARLMMPKTSIRICGGREVNLRDFQSMIFFAGADSFMSGGYLVTPGRGRDEDIQMIKDM
jgi:biotin synthase